MGAEVEPPLDVGEVGKEGEGAWSLATRDCSSLCLILDSFVERARSLPGGGFCSMPKLGSLSTFSACGGAGCT